MVGDREFAGFVENQKEKKETCFVALGGRKRREFNQRSLEVSQLAVA